MSEYQYYEFQAVDRPLTGTEMAELRALSTRAQDHADTAPKRLSLGQLQG